MHGVLINSRAEERIPHILNIAIPQVSSHDAVISLDMQGIAISAGSACSMRSIEPSHVLQAIGAREEVVKSSIRFSLGRPTTKKEIDEVVRRIQKIATS